MLDFNAMINWSASGPSSYYSVAPYGNGNAGCSAVFSTSGFWTLEAQARNDCGWGSKYQHNIWVELCRGGSSTLAYPNPVSDVLYVELEALDGDSRTQLAYDVRLYDWQGRMVRQQFSGGGTVQFKVADLPVGVYFLHIYDGVSDKPEMHQIVVEH